MKDYSLECGPILRLLGFAPRADFSCQRTKENRSALTWSRDDEPPTPEQIEAIATGTERLAQGPYADLYYSAALEMERIDQSIAVIRELVGDDERLAAVRREAFEARKA
ncbi:MAG: hypothetical protein AAGG44_13955 [Planctomycetota bacterium]